MKYFFLCFVTFLTIAGKAQIDTIKHSKNIFYVTAGTSNTVDYNNGATKPTYTGVSASFTYSRILGKHFMFQTGVEYALTNYFISYIEGGGNYNDSYADMKFRIHTFSIPVYLNLLVCHKKLFIGLGANIDVLPRSVVNGIDVSNYPGIPNSKIYNETGYLKPFDVGVALKIGYFLKIKKQKFLAEVKFKHGLYNLGRWNDDYIIYNNYITVGIGYIFKNKRQTAIKK